MSTHANQEGCAPGAPNRKKIMGANPTYKSAVQKDKCGPGSNMKKAVVENRKTEQPPNPTGNSVKMPKPTGFGDGHYVKK